MPIRFVFERQKDELRTEWHDSLTACVAVLAWPSRTDNQIGAEAEAVLDGDRETAVGLLLRLGGLVEANQQLVEANERLEARVAELELRLNRSSRNSSLPPSQDPPSAPSRLRGKGSGRKRGGQHGHEGRYRRLLPPEQVDEFIEHWPERYRSCAHEFAEADRLEAVEAFRRQVAELPPVVVR